MLAMRAPAKRNAGNARNTRWCAQVRSFTFQIDKNQFHDCRAWLDRAIDDHAVGRENRTQECDDWSSTDYLFAAPDRRPGIAGKGALPGSGGRQRHAPDRIRKTAERPGV